MAFQFKMLKNILQKRIRNLRLSLPLTQRFFSDNSECKGKSASKIFPKLIFARPIMHSLFISSQNMLQVPRNFCGNFTSDFGKGSLTSDCDSESDLEDKAEHSAISLLKNETFRTKSYLSDSEWKEVLDIFKQSPEFSRMTSHDGSVMNFCAYNTNLALANSYMSYLETQNSKPNLYALACYLLLCGNMIEECGEDKVLEVYKQLCRETKIFEVLLSEHAILALTKTSEWRQAFKHLPDIRRLGKVSRTVYSALIIASFRNGEYDTGWQLLDTMYREEKNPIDNVFLEWIKQCELGENQEAMMNTLLHKLGLYYFYVKVPVAEEIIKFYRKNLEWTGRYVRISNSDSCPACNHRLEPIDLDEEAFQELQEKFVTQVLIGSDIYKSTSPKEWSRFKEFLERNGPFTTVIDGLNVALSAKNHLRRLKEVVLKVKNSKGKNNILVIGRKHMESWRNKDFQIIKSYANIFTLDNYSKDDGFFIYAALQSGNGCQFVTGDLLRNHLYHLGDLSLKETFRQWQRKHQIFLKSPNRFGFTLVPPPVFKVTAQSQSAADGWHIPYNDGSIQESFQVPHTWLCLQSNAQNHEGHHPETFVSKNVIENSKDKSSPHLSNPKQFRPKPSRDFDAKYKNNEYERSERNDKYQTHVFRYSSFERMKMRKCMEDARKIQMMRKMKKDS